MCGIAGTIGRQGPVETWERVDRMVAAMVHRGPDGRGSLVRGCGEWSVGLGHNRLAILDLSPAGAQPMLDPSGTRAIVFNGEIYNYLDLRNELARTGIEFRSTGDTEVILRGYEKWGLDLLPRLRGMFTFAIWDPAAARVVLARDPLGIKPLYLYESGGIVSFASEIRALLATGLVPRKLSREGVASYLNYGSVSSPHTIVEGIESVAPGECIEVVLGPFHTVRRSRFEARTAGGRPPQSRGEAVEQLGAALDDSVSRHLISDVPVALFLSGGVDSSALAAIMAKRLGRPTRSFNVAFGEREYAENHFAAEIARQFGTDHTEVLLTADDMLGMLPGALGSMDQPTMDGVNTWVVSKAVADAGIKVAISGLGGDELFGGYSSFRRALVLDRIRRVPRTLRRAAAATGNAFMSGTVRTAKFWEMLASEADPASAYTISRRLFSAAETEGLAGIAPPELPLEAGGDDIVNSISRLEFTGYMTNTLLRDTDFMSMAHSLEVRVPFVDAEVLDLVLRVPGAWKLDPNRPKPLLLDAVGGVLPDSIWRRPKMGFTLPFRKWIASALRPEVDRVLAGGVLKSFGVSADAAAGVWTKFCADPDGERWTRPWSLYVLARWCERNGVTA